MLCPRRAPARLHVPAVAPALATQSQRPFYLDTLPSRLCPGDGEVNDLPALLGLTQTSERLENDLPLQLPMERYAEVMAHHERHEDRARRLGMLGDIASHADGDGGNTLSFNSALHERD